MRLNPFASAIRPVLAGHLGAIAAAHPLAVAAGQEMLAAGGGAVDAVIAAQAVLAVIAPDACGLGGDAFLLIREPGRAVHAVNGAGRSARRQSSAAADGGASVTVPGMVSAWELAASQWSRLPLAHCLQPAIRLARSGVNLDAHLVEAVRSQRPRLMAGGAAAWPLLAAAAGEQWVQPEMATTLEGIAKGGRSAIYSGAVAQAIVAAVARHGGVLGLDDLAEHVTETPVPITISWRGLRVSVQPPVSQGILLAAVLAAEERLGAIPSDRVDHAAVELTNAAFALRSRVGEGERLLTETLPCDLEHASRTGGPRSYLHTAGVCAADRSGTVVSSLVSVFDDFGSGVFVPEAGFVLNNRGGGFTTPPNDFAPGKHPIHTLAPIMVAGENHCVGLATPGADGQVQTLLQVLLSWAGAGGDLAEAVAKPRWRSQDGKLLVEGGHPAADRLRELGHDVVDAPSGDMRFGAVTVAGLKGAVPFALGDWRRITWSGLA
jgi:gamma-glutamyltranspeptidase/glutathione hydrolase